MSTPSAPAARPTDRAATAATIALLLALAALLLPTLGLYPLFDVDEGAFSEATREMLQSGDWLSTTLNGAPRWDKPILVYWLQAACVAAFGLDEFALRLPSALAALAWVLAIARFAAPRVGSAAALLAAWIAASSLGVLAMAHAATADALLNALLAAMMFDLWRHLEPVRAEGAGARAPLRRAYLWMALGVLAKGPIAMLVAGAVTLAYCATAGRWRDWLRTAFDPVGWLILLGVAGPWYAAQLWLHGRDFIDGFLVRHNLERFHGTLEGHGGSLGYYLVVGPLLLLPWSGLIWQAARRVPGEWRDPLLRYLVLWFAFVFVFFSLSGTKLPHYLLYGMTPVFLLVARVVRTHGTARNLLLLPGLLLAALPVLPAALQRWSARSADLPLPFYAAQARRSLEAAGPGYYAVTVGCALALVGVLAAARRGAGAPRPGAGHAPWRQAVAASALLAVALGYGLAPWLGAVLNAPVRDAARVAAGLPGTAVQWEFAAPSFSVYRRQITPARPPEPGELAITRTDRLAPQAPVERIFEEGGVALVRRR
jgi:4-amino-4-deoxy-L-arabinose transferase-like glycosyltransferase